MIETIITIALFTTGLHVLSMKGMILHYFTDKFTGLVYKITPKAAKLILKPIIDCPPCMCSVYGPPIYFWFNPELSITNSVNLIICLISAASISFLITQFWNE